MKSLIMWFSVIGLVMCSIDASAKSSVEESKIIVEKHDLKINVYAYFSKSIEQFVKIASNDLRKQEDLKTFCEQGHVVHCTLYMTDYLPDQEEKVRAIVASMAKSEKPFSALLTGFHLTAGNWFFLNLKKTDILQQLSDKLVHELSPLRALNQEPPGWLVNYPQKLESFKKYGSPNVFADFEPHITLLANSDEGKLVRFIESAKSNPKLNKEIIGEIIGIGVGVADSFGQMKSPPDVYIFPTLK